MAGEIRTCRRCGTLPGEPCAGTDGDFCVGMPGDGTRGDGLPIDHLAGARWWTCLVGTTWCVLDAEPDQPLTVTPDGAVYGRLQ